MALLGMVVVLVTLLGLGAVGLRYAFPPPDEGEENTDSLRQSGDGESGQAQSSAGNSVGPGGDPKPSGGDDLSALRRKVLPSLVIIRTKTGRGTGFLLGQNLVATARHVVAGGSEATAVLYNGEHTAIVEQVACDAANDAAILRIETKTALQPLQLAWESPAVGEKVASFQPGGGELQGKILQMPSGLDRTASAVPGFLPTTLNAVPGWSGSPVVNLQGQVVGIIAVLDGAQFRAAGIKIATGSAAVPLPMIQRVLALARMNEAIRCSPNDVKGYMNRAGRYYSIGDFGKAIEDYSQVIEREPTARALCLRGQAHAAKGELGKAIRDYDKALALEPTYAEACQGRAAAHEKQDHVDEAIADYQAAIRLLPSSDAASLRPVLARLHRTRARDCARQGKYDKAIADYSEMLCLTPEDAVGHGERGEVYGRMGENEKAVNDYTEAICLQPLAAELYRHRGVLYTVRGDHDEAIADFAKVIQLEPNDAEAYCARAAVHGARREFNKAVDDYSSAISLDPLLGKAYFGRANAYKELGDPNASEKDLKCAKDLGLFDRN